MLALSVAQLALVLQPAAVPRAASPMRAAAPVMAAAAEYARAHSERSFDLPPWWGSLPPRAACL